MTKVWLLPKDAESAPDAAGDDLLVRVVGDDSDIARVKSGGAEWLGSVPASVLSLPDAGPEAVTVDDAAALIAVEGAASALVERGG